MRALNSVLCIVLVKDATLSGRLCVKFKSMNAEVWYDRAVERLTLENARSLEFLEFIEHEP